MTKKQIRPIGVIYGLLSALLFGLSTPLAKILVGTIEPMMLAGLLYLGSGFGLTLLWLFNRVRRPERFTPIKKADVPWLLGAIAFGGILSPVSLLFGMSMTMGSTAALLLNLESVFTAVIAWIVFRENCDRRIVLGMVAIALGGISLSATGQDGIALSWGCGFVILACLGWAIDNNLTRQISHADAVQIALIKGLFAGSINLGTALLLGGGIPSAVPVTAAAIVGFLGYGLSLVLFVMALRHIGTARTGAYFSTAPFVGAIVAILLLREPVTLNLGVAALLMGIGVWLHLTEKHEHIHEHEEIEHEHEHVHDEHHQHSHGPNAPVGEPHSHAHKHERLTHSHPHYPDSHHRHEH